MRNAARFCCTLLLAVIFVACGETTDDPPPTFELPPGDDTEVIGGDTDTGPDIPDEVLEETEDETADDVEVIEEVELPPGVECLTATDCAGKLDPTDCDASATLCCDEVCTAAGKCIYETKDLCCITVGDCSKFYPDLGGCDQIFCNTQSQQCELKSPDNCCVIDEDCAIEGATCCTSTFCGSDKTCHVEEFSNCCVDSADCDDGNEATTDVCESSCQDNGCANLAPECDVDKVFINRNFDDGSLQLMSVFDSHPDDEVTISVIKSTKVSPGFSAYFGNPACKSYYNGEKNGCEPTTWNAAGSTSLNLTLTTQEFGLDPNAGAFLGFWIKMSAEPSSEVDFGLGEVTLIDTDYLVIKVDDGVNETTVWKSTEALGKENTTQGDWVFQTANLSSWSNTSVKVSFSFITDSTGNYNINEETESWKGVYLDSIRVQAACASTACDEDNPGCPDDLNGCTAETCTLFSQGGGGVCAMETTTPGQSCKGCVDDPDCGNDDCYTYACHEGICDADLKEECCEPSSTFPDTTSPPDVSYEGFESGLGQEWMIEDPYDDNISWQVSSIVPFEGSSALFFGDPILQNYQATPPNPALATIWTPYFQVANDLFRKPVASFWLWMSTEFDGSDNLNNVDCDKDTYDRLTLYVEDGDTGESMEIWNSCEATANTTGGQWINAGADMSAYAGKQVRLGFEFDSDDPDGVAKENQYNGVRIDNLTLSNVCGADACVASLDCDDADLCTADLCTLGACSNTKENASCCTSDGDCDDNNGCTDDACTSNLCTSSYKQNLLSSCCDEGPWVGEWYEGFEGGLGSFTTDNPTPPVTWHHTEDQAANGAGSANFSGPNGTYNINGFPTDGRLISPPITVPPLDQGYPYAEFKLLLDTEWNYGKAGFEAPLFVGDTLRVYVAVDGNFFLMEQEWISWFTNNTTDGQWIDTRVDLDAYRGQEVQLVFEFKTYDDDDNKHGGPFIDDVGFGTTCKPGSAVQCLYTGDCGEPADECKYVSCSQDFKCLNAPLDTLECCEPYSVPDLFMGFEGDGSDWAFDSCDQAGFAPFDEQSVWHFTDKDGAADTPVKQGDQVLYFGNGTSYGGNGDGEGYGACGVATSPVFTLPADELWTMEFWLQLAIEPTPDCMLDCQTGGANCFSVDDLIVSLVDVDTGISGNIWTKADTGCDDYTVNGKWIRPVVDLTGWDGKTVQLRFTFNSFDYGPVGIENDGKGILVDGVEFIQGCEDAP